MQSDVVGSIFDLYRRSSSQTLDQLVGTRRGTHEESAFAMRCEQIWASSPGGPDLNRGEHMAEASMFGTKTLGSMSIL